MGMEAFYIPVLSHFQNGNAWSASAGTLRYRVVPAGEELTVEGWQGPWCYELSRVEERAAFPLSEEGLEALRAWVLDRAAELNKRPAETLAETIARRDAVAQEAKEGAT